MPSIKLVKSQNLKYPVKTEGAVYARELRERSNQMSDEERAESVKRAMERIYAASDASPVGPRH
jgi:hypothetical protein